MSRAIQVLIVVVPPAYLATAILFGMAFAGARQPRLASPARRIAFALTLVAHGTLLALQARAAGGFPHVTTWLLVSAVAWTTALLFATVSWRSQQETPGAIVLGLVGLLQLVASALGPLAPLPGEGTAFRYVHVGTSVVASAALILSGVYGSLHLLLYRQMRERRFGPLFRELPNLDLLAKMTRRSALAGFLFLTLGLNVGIWMAHRFATRGFQYEDPHVLLTLALWIHFGVIAFSSWIRGLTARRTSFAAAAGLLTLLLLMLLTLVPSFTFHSLG